MYAFHPPHLILQTLGKFARSSGVLLLITPWLQDAAWLGEAVALSLWPLIYLQMLTLQKQPEGAMQSASHGMDIMCERVISAGVPPQVAAFVASSIRWTSAAMYESAWKSWEAWCNTHGVDRFDLSEISLTRYLSFLFKECNLAYSTLAIHRASISTLLDPGYIHSLFTFTPMLYESHILGQTTSPCVSASNLGGREDFDPVA